MEGQVLAQNEEEDFYYHKNLNMEKDTLVWSDFPIPRDVEAESVKLFLENAIDEFLLCLEWEAH